MTLSSLNNQRTSTRREEQPVRVAIPTAGTLADLPGWVTMLSNSIWSASTNVGCAPVPKAGWSRLDRVSNGRRMTNVTRCVSVFPDVLLAATGWSSNGTTLAFRDPAEWVEMHVIESRR